MAGKDDQAGCGLGGKDDETGPCSEDIRDIVGRIFEVAKQMVDHRMTLFPRSSLIRGIGFPVEIYRVTFVA